MALQRPVRIKCILPVESIVVEKVQPDLFLETEEGEVLHAEVQGYPLREFAVRNLIYYGLAYRDFGRPPRQIVFWIGREKLGIGEGLSDPPNLEYRYPVVDLRELDGETLLANGNVSEAIFAILCKLKDEQAAVSKIVDRIRTLPASEWREAVGELLILSGLRNLKPIVEREVEHMPYTMTIHNNTYLNDIWQKGRAEGQQEGVLEGLREAIRTLAKARFGQIPERLSERLTTLDKQGLDDLLAKAGTVSSLSDLDLD